MGQRLLSVVAACTVAMAGAVQAREGRVLAPSSGWTVVYDEDSCVLRRSFGEADQQGYLEIRRFAPNGRLQVMVASRDLKARDIFTYQYMWGDEANWREAGRLKFTLDNGLGGVLFRTQLVEEPDEPTDPRERALYLHSADWRAAERGAAERVDSISVRGTTIRGMQRSALRLQLGNLVAPIAALNTCADELITHWGIDVEAHKTLTRPALPIDPTASSSMVGYPPKMVRQGMQGLVNIRLAIDQTGRITACRIQMPLSDPEFEATSCADIQHAFEFEPAQDKDGNPIASYWVTSVYFQIGR